jgi:8-amino-3,8-dideoxy-alpha-D-manno-octulosonate transaminase
MKLPTVASPLYVKLRKLTPWSLRPDVRGAYNHLAKLLTYGHTDIFMTVNIETTSQCNIKCPYCPVSVFDRGKHLMEESLFHKIIDELAEVGFKGRVSPHFYGEPLVDARLPELCAYAREKLPAVNIVVHSNGTRMNKTVFHNLLDHGVTGFVITNHMGLATKQVARLLSEISEADKEKIRFLDIDETPLFNRSGLVEPKNLRTFKRCHYLSDEIAISYQGNVLCTNDYLEKHSFGNVNEQKLMDIWHSPFFTKVRKEVRKGVFELEMCKKCVHGCGQDAKLEPPAPVTQELPVLQASGADGGR